MTKYHYDKTLNKILKSILDNTKKLTGSAVKMIDSDSKWIEGDRLFFDPIRETKSFARKPFGTHIREEARYHLCMASEEICRALVLTEKYYWLLSEEDTKYLEETWRKIDQIYLHKKS